MAIIFFSTETLSLEGSLHSVIQFNWFYMKKWSFIDLSLFLVAIFVLDKSWHSSGTQCHRFLENGLERAKTQLCHSVCYSWSSNQLTACRRRMIIYFPQLQSTVESLVHTISWTWIIPWPNHTEYLPLLPNFQNITDSSSQSQFATLTNTNTKKYFWWIPVCSLCSFPLPSPIPLQYSGGIFVSSCL